jgi:hypothetical protein
MDSNRRFPCRVPHFSRPPRTRRRQTGSAARTGFDDRQAQVYRAPSQAGLGNDINAGSPGFQKAPTWGPASLALFASSRPMPGDAVSRRSSIYVTSRSFGTHYTLRSDTTIENAAYWRPGRFWIRPSRGGRPYRGGPRVRIRLPPAASPMRTSLTPDATATDRPALAARIGR